MKQFVRYFTVVGAILLTLGACSTFPRQLGPLAEGELRLNSLHLPDTMQEGVSYDAVVDFEGRDPSVIKRICFQWVSENVALSSSSLYCYAYEVQTNQPIGAVCPRWVAEGPYAAVSPTFCFNPEEIRYEGSGRFTVKIPATAVKAEYNRLSCYVAYIRHNDLVETNKVSARTLIQK